MKAENIEKAFALDVERNNLSRRLSNETKAKNKTSFFIAVDNGAQLGVLVPVLRLCGNTVEALFKNRISEIEKELLLLGVTE